MQKLNLDEEVVKLGFNTISKGIFLILEYNEIDLIWFLTLKKRIRYYLPLLYLKSSLIIIYIILLFLANSLLVRYQDLLSTICWIILFLYLLFDYIYFIKFRYSLWFYRKRKDFLNRLNKQISLMINNQTLSELIEAEIKEFKKKQPQLNKRIKHFSTSIKSFRTHLEKSSIIIAIFVPFITFLLDLSIEYYKNLGSIDQLVLNELLWNLIQFCFNLGIFGFYVININHRRFNSKKAYIIISEALIESIIVALVSMVKLVEFPNEKEKAEKLRKDLTHWKETL